MATTQVQVSPDTAAAAHTERTPDPCIVVIFGASGDLTKRKLLPALYHLRQGGLLPQDFAVLGVARRPLEQSFAPDMKEGIIAGGGVDESDPKLAPFVDRVQYYAMNFDNDEAYGGLKNKLAEIDGTYKTRGNRLFYLATAPEYFSDIVKFLGEHGMAQPEADASGKAPWVRTIIEKPFGHDLE